MDSLYLNNLCEIAMIFFILLVTNILCFYDLFHILLSLLLNSGFMEL
jgi:hypothetical protein